MVHLCHIPPLGWMPAASGATAGCEGCTAVSELECPAEDEGYQITVIREHNSNEDK